MTRRRPGRVTVKILAGGRTAELSGGRDVLGAIKRHGVPHMRSRHGKAWWVPARHVDDICALLESRGHRIDEEFPG
jgi:hypothetical protein